MIRGNTELTKERLHPEDPAQEILGETAAACRRAELLASQLLTFTKGGAPVRRLASVEDIVMDVVQLLRVDVSLAEDLRFAYIDPGQIGQVLHNILLNGRQAMREGGIIEVRAENAVCPDAVDTDPYFTTKPGASGLGLATVYVIVTKHEGHVLVESTRGVGTVFTVDLPASYDVPVVPTPVVAKAQTGTERLLVMDDEEALRKPLKVTLTKLGYEVRTAQDGAEAITLYEDAQKEGRPFDAVLLDLTVSGGMGGVETAGKLKQLDPSAKVVPGMSEVVRRVILAGSRSQGRLVTRCYQ